MMDLLRGEELDLLSEVDSAEDVVAPSRRVVVVSQRSAARGFVGVLAAVSVVIGVGCAIAVATVSSRTRAVIIGKVSTIGLDEQPDDVDNYFRRHPFANISSAFVALDVNQDGLIQVEQDGVNTTLTFDQFSAAVKADQDKSVQVQGPAAVSAMSHIKGLAQNPDNLNKEPPTPMKLKGPAPVEQGFVSDLYTYGAPGTGSSPLYDARSPNGCMAGLRVYSKGPRYTPTTKTYFAANDPVAGIGSILGYHHALVDSFEVSDVNYENNNITLCSDKKNNINEPPLDDFWWIPGHLMYPGLVTGHEDSFPESVKMKSAADDLRRRLRGVNSSQERRLMEDAGFNRIHKAALMARFAFMDYRESQQVGIDAPLWGWRMVGRACSDNPAHTANADGAGIIGMGLQVTPGVLETMTTWVPGCDDRTILYQEDSTLNCAVVFEGSDDFLDWLANFDFFPADFCGMGKVHAGFRAKMIRMVGGVDFMQVIRSKLPYCAKVTLVGHSLGAAQAEMFATCANQGLSVGENGYWDSKLTSFGKLTPTKLPDFYEDHAQGSFFRNKGNGMCIDVEGIMSTEYNSDVIIYDCETPNSTFSKDQQWKMDGDGFIVSAISHMCIDGSENKTVEGVLTQRTCEHGSANTYQQWEYTKQGFLRNKKNRQCINDKMSLYACPFSDQKFAWKSNGRIENDITGSCLDIDTSNGMVGPNVVIEVCNYDAEHKSQEWTLVDGQLKNVGFGSCMVVVSQAGQELHANLVLGACKTEYGKAELSWVLTANGNFVNERTDVCMNVAGNPGTRDKSNVNIRRCDSKLKETSGIWNFLPRGFIKNSGNLDGQFKCIEVFGQALHPDWSLKDGQKLRLDYCRINSDQKWELTSDGHLRNVLGGQKCLESKPLTAEGGQFNQLWLQNCELDSDRSYHPNLKWSRKANGAIVNRLWEKCLDVSGQAGTSGNEWIDLWQCENKSDTDQRWNLTDAGEIQSLLSGKCLIADSTALPSGYFPLKLGSCSQDATLNGTHRWEFLANGFLKHGVSYQSLHVKTAKIANFQCVGSVPEPNSAGVQVSRAVLLPCPVSQQLWTYSPEGRLRNQHTGRCIDIQKGNTSANPWWALGTDTCDQTRSTQEWGKLTFPMAKGDVE